MLYDESRRKVASSCPSLCLAAVTMKANALYLGPDEGNPIQFAIPVLTSRSLRKNGSDVSEPLAFQMALQVMPGDAG